MIKIKVKKKFQDRRKAERLNIPLKIKFKLSACRKMLGEALCQNISGGGLCFHFKACLKKGTKLKIFLYFPDYPKPILVYSRVIWCKKILGKDTKLFDVGIKFVKIDPKDGERFIFLIGEMMIDYFVLGKNKTSKKNG